MSLVEKYGRDVIKELLLQELKEQHETYQASVGFQPLYYGLCERMSNMYGENIGGWDELPERDIKGILKELADKKMIIEDAVRLEPDHVVHDVYKPTKPLPQAIIPDL